MTSYFISFYFLTFGSDTLVIPKQNEIDQRIPVLVEDALRWPTMGGSYMEVLGRLGALLVDLLGGKVNFNTVDPFGMVLDTGLTLMLVRSRGAERTD